MAGRCELYVGPMFAGKTTEILRKVDRARQGGLPGVVVKYAGDTRYTAAEDPTVQTHAGLTVGPSGGGESIGKLRVVAAELLADVELAPDERDIAVDEGQFYSDLVETVDRWVAEGRRVYVAALDGNFRREPFEVVSRLYPRAAQFEKLTAVCTVRTCCPPDVQTDAPFTVRTVAGDEWKMVGGADKYRAACLACYLRYSS